MPLFSDYGNLCEDQDTELGQQFHVTAYRGKVTTHVYASGKVLLEIQDGPMSDSFILEIGFDDLQQIAGVLWNTHTDVKRRIRSFQEVHS